MHIERSLTILHEYGAPAHYAGLIPLCKGEVVFREFSISRKFFRALQKKDFKLFLKTLNNLIWLISTFLFPSLNKGKLVVLGMAPLDSRVYFIRRILKYSDIVYHSSWVDWGRGNYPKKYKFFNRHLETTWKNFLQKKVYAIASVTTKTKDEIASFIGDDHKINVVYHSFSGQFLNSHRKNQHENIRVIFVGRIVHQKGISKIIDLAKFFPNFEFSLVGEVDSFFVNKVKEMKLKNVNFRGFISDKKQLAKLCSECDIVLLPSLRIEGWEELFGISLIEAMAMGCVPITTDHMGPAEILNSTKLKGHIFSEEEFVEKAISLMKSFHEDRSFLSKKQDIAVEVALKFSQENIGRRWFNVINHQKAE